MLFAHPELHNSSIILLHSDRKANNPVYNFSCRIFYLPLAFYHICMLYFVKAYFTNLLNIYDIEESISQSCRLFSCLHTSFVSMLLLPFYELKKAGDAGKSHRNLWILTDFIALFLLPSHRQSAYISVCKTYKLAPTYQEESYGKTQT